MTQVGSHFGKNRRETEELKELCSREKKSILSHFSVIECERL